MVRLSWHSAAPVHRRRSLPIISSIIDGATLPVEKKRKIDHLATSAKGLVGNHRKEGNSIEGPIWGHEAVDDCFPIGEVHGQTIEIQNSPTDGSCEVFFGRDGSFLTGLR